MNTELSSWFGSAQAEKGCQSLDGKKGSRAAIRFDRDSQTVTRFRGGSTRRKKQSPPMVGTGLLWLRIFLAIQPAIIPSVRRRFSRLAWINLGLAGAGVGDLEAAVSQGNHFNP